MEDKILDQLRFQKRIGSVSASVLRAAKENSLTLGMVEVKLENLEKYKVCFDAGHAELLLHYKERLKTTEYWREDFEEQVEDNYSEQKAILYDLRAKLKRETNGTHHTERVSRSSLRPLQLPEFEGKFEEWPAFRDLFLSIIDREEDISNLQKLQHLKVSLKGPASALISDIPTLESNYARAWKVLTDHYENKRVLVDLALSKLSALRKLKSESARELEEIYLRVTSLVHSLEGIGRPVNSTHDLLIFLVVELFDYETRSQWEMLSSQTSEPPTYEQLSEFIQRRIQTMLKVQPMKVEAASRSRGTSSGAPPRAHTKVHLAQREDRLNGRCPLCKRDHPLMFCSQYKSKPAAEKKRVVEQHRLCFNCLGKHAVVECTCEKRCFKCQQQHHTSLHDVFSTTFTHSIQTGSGPSDETATSAPSSSHQATAGSSTVLLATARVLVEDRCGNYHSARALVDQGSETSMVTEDLVQRLHLQRKKASVAIFGVGGIQSGVARGKVALTFRALHGNEAFRAGALIMPRLSIYASKLNSASPHWEHISGLELADPKYFSADPIDLILGADVYAAILRSGLRKGNTGEPIAQQTSLGWILSGGLKEGISSAVTSMQCVVGDALSTLVRSFWEQEELGTLHAALTPDEIRCEEHFLNTHKRDEQGRYVLRLPFKAAMSDVSATRVNACRALKYNERRFARNPELQHLYVGFLQQYEELNHMTRVSKAPTNRQVAYLPHHGVLRESSVTTRLRVVFNGSAITSEGTSLNQQLLTGPNLLPSLADILLKWRMFKFVLISDIEKMYRQILVDPRDRDWQRILRRPSADHDVAEYQLNTVTYGLGCAPYMAIRTIHQLAEDEASAFPLGALALKENMYVDDILTGAASEEQLLELKRQLLQICMAGGFPLQKWASNSEELLQTLPQAAGSTDQCIDLGDKDEAHLTLGLQWHPRSDVFTFSVKEVPETAVTRRTILSQAAQLFDPLGWLTPVTVRAKIYIQSTWLLKVDWDAALPTSLVEKWTDFRSQWSKLTSIVIPRPVTLGSMERLELIGFCDASEQAYAAVLYLRQFKETGESLVSLLTAKSKVAPLQQVSLPRLELCAAVLLVRLTHRVQEVLKLQHIPVHFWSDSTVTLAWINGHPNKWATYVANRVSEIQRLQPDATWRHIAGVDNPADCASRGVSPAELLDHPLWWKGPKFLEQQELPSFIEEVPEEVPEQRRATVLTVGTRSYKEEDQIINASSYLRLIRVTAWCRRWLPSQQRGLKTNLMSSCLSALELEEAETRWLKITQQAIYPEELSALEKGKPLKPRSPLLQLTPFLDKRGLLRVGGRLKHSMLSMEQAHPIILPSCTRFTELLAGEFHKRTLHGGVQLTLGAIRQRYWVMQGRSLVKRIIHRCVTCARWRAAPPTAVMGDLPAARVRPARPFQFTGVDYAGPIMLRTAPGRGVKAYKGFLAVFVCLSTKAVHLEVVSDYTSDAFIASLKRMISRRGVCTEIRSDQGTNFVGADAELQRMFAASSSTTKEVVDFLATLRIRWKFNPPGAPHFGGLWEAAVKSTKFHLRRVLGSHTLTFEEMTTLLAQIEACLNSRPLCALSDDPDDMQALTPGHFLIGGALNALPEASLLEINESRLSRWQLITRMRDQFWDRWSKDYLRTLAPRTKWQSKGVAVLPGTMCIVIQDNLPPSSWSLARVISAHPGPDGHVRVVTVRTATRTFDRPIAKLVILPIDSDMPTLGEA